MENPNISKDEALNTISVIRSDIKDSKKSSKKKRGFENHLLSYIFVILMLWWINWYSLISSGNYGGYPVWWAIYPTLGWWVGLLLHFFVRDSFIFFYFCFFEEISYALPYFTDILRFRIAVSLAKSSSDFNNLKTEFLVTDGNLSFHLKKLESEWIVSIEKTFKWKKPHTKIILTDDWKRKLLEHLDELEKIIRNT